MTERFNLTQQIQGGEILLRKAREVLTKSGVRAGEADRIIAQQEQLIASARGMLLIEDEAREMIMAKKRAAV